MTVRCINICLLGRSGIRNDLQTVVEELVAALERVGVTLGAVCQGLRGGGTLGISLHP